MSAVKVIGKVGDIVVEYHFDCFDDFLKWEEWSKDIPQESDKSLPDEGEVKVKRGLQEGEYIRFSNKDIAKVKEDFELHFSKYVWDDIEEVSKRNPYIYVENRFFPTEEQPYIWCTHEDHLYIHSTKRVDI